MSRTFVEIPPCNPPSIGREPRRPDRLPRSPKPKRLAIGAKTSFARTRVPEMDLFVTAPGGCRPAPIRAEGSGGDDIVMAGIAGDKLAAGGVEDLIFSWACTFARPQQQQLAVRAEAQRANGSILLWERAQKAPVTPVPQPDLTRAVAAGDCPIAGYGKAPHLIAMARHPSNLRTISHAPEPEIVIIRASHRAVAIGAEADGGDKIRMPFEPAP